ncbi:MAG TPA: hypothetical protein VEZ48_01005 [Sphingomonadaceae bacterium]|jgi:hypothetical protein|nr:hypothetical protein [Sphingomonadaceae bacterium]
MMHQRNEGEAPDTDEVAEVERRFAEVIRRFWRLPRSPASTTKDNVK